MDDDVPRVRRFALVDHAVAAKYQQRYQDVTLCVLSVIDCAFAVNSPEWGDGKSFLELFMPEVEPDLPIPVAATHIASRLIFNHQDEKWGINEEPYDSTVVALIISESTERNEAFAIFIEALKNQLKELGREQLTIEVYIQV